MGQIDVIVRDATVVDATAKSNPNCGVRDGPSHWFLRLSSVLLFTVAACSASFIYAFTPYVASGLRPHELVPSLPLDGAHGCKKGGTTFAAPGAAIHVVTVATKVTSALEDLQCLLQAFGYSYHVRGLGMTDFTWKKRMELYAQAVTDISREHGDETTVVLVVDAYDTVPLRPAKQLQAYLEAHPLQAGVLTGGDEICFSNCEPLGDAWWQQVQGPGMPIPRFSHVDGGALMGAAANMSRVYEWNIANYPADDQIALSRYFRTHGPGYGRVDTAHAIFGNVAMGRLPQNAGRWLCGQDPASPFFVHLPWQHAEDGLNKALRNLVAPTLLIPDVAKRREAADLIEHAWPGVKAALEERCYYAKLRRTIVFILAIMLSVLCVALACMAAQLRNGYPVATWYKVNSYCSKSRAAVILLTALGKALAWTCRVLLPVSLATALSSAGHAQPGED